MQEGHLGRCRRRRQFTTGSRTGKQRQNSKRSPRRGVGAHRCFYDVDCRYVAGTVQSHGLKRRSGVWGTVWEPDRVAGSVNDRLWHLQKISGKVFFPCSDQLRLGHKYGRRLNDDDRLQIGNRP